METVIDEKNFEEYFFDVRRHKPQKGQVMAKFSAIAELIDGQMKEHIVYLLKAMPNGAESAVKVIHKLGCATYGDAIRVALEIAEDLLQGECESSVVSKPYEYHYEQFFYTERDNIPLDDPHWSALDILNLDEHIERTSQGEIRSRIILDKNKDANS
mgnify:FL=1